MTHTETAARSGATAGPAPDRRRWAALTLLCLAQFMLILEITAVNVALPAMGHPALFSR